MKKLLIKTAVIAAGVASVGIVGAPAASANSFTTSVNGGTASYNDGEDRFCAHAWNSEGLRYVRVTLTALSRPGPSHDFTDRNTYYSGGNAGNTCRSLATAYEDTKYRAVIRGYWGETGDIQTKTVEFWS